MATKQVGLELDELWMKIKKTSDEALINELVKKGGKKREDLALLGREGLMQAVYDLRKASGEGSLPASPSRGTALPAPPAAAPMTDLTAIMHLLALQSKEAERA